MAVRVLHVAATGDPDGALAQGLTAPPDRPFGGNGLGDRPDACHKPRGGAVLAGEGDGPPGGERPSSDAT
ncbi:Uncharacterised protein [Mycobacterium tuberculosis]|nr:Uncharacterised protein [Mycobacterium tuberculosis]